MCVRDHNTCMSCTASRVSSACGTGDARSARGSAPHPPPKTGRSARDTLTWFAALVMMGTYLNKLGFIG